MLKLRLEEIAIEESQRRVQPSPSQERQQSKSFLIEINEKQIVHILLKREHTPRYSVFKGNPLKDVFHYEVRFQECTHTYLMIEDREVPSKQGTFRHNEAGIFLYENECNHGTLLIPANAAEPNPNHIYGNYNARPGDQFLLGFPRSIPRFKATIIKN